MLGKLKQIFKNFLNHKKGRKVLDFIKKFKLFFFLKKIFLNLKKLKNPRKFSVFWKKLNSNKKKFKKLNFKKF